MATVRLKQLLGVTGTPGTGKKTVALRVAKALRFSALSLNTLAYRFDCVAGTSQKVVVDTGRLRESLRKRAWKKALFHGHLLPEVFRDGELDRVFVLRCDPAILKERLRRRGYVGDHLRENVEAELIGVSLSASIRAFGSFRVREYDTSESRPDRVCEAIISDYRSKRSGKKTWMDWTNRYDSATELRSLLSVPRTASAFT